MKAANSVVVSFAPSLEMRGAIETSLRGLATITYLPELDDAERLPALSTADVLLAWRISGELRGEAELERLQTAKLIQLLSAGVNHIPFDGLPAGVAVAANAGAYAEPMAEHVLALALALAKRLPQTHAQMARGVFDQQRPNRALSGSVVAVLGYGGVGRASAHLFRGLGARIEAVTRSGHTDDPVDRVAPLSELHDVLSTADVVIIALPLTRATHALIGARELTLMKRDAILVNVARAAIVDEDALFDHLQRCPTFSAGLDVWWHEPGGRERFASRFLELPNVIASPHNSANTTGSLAEAARRASANVARHLRGEPPRHLVNRSDYV